MAIASTRTAHSVIIFCACLSLFLLSKTVSAQSAGNGRPAAPVETINSPDQVAMRMREWSLTHIADDINSHFKKDSVSLFPQIREDFTQIQKVNNQTMQTVFVQKSTDYKLIAKAAAEINKRAVRLRESLLLPKLDEKPDKPALVLDQMSDDKLKQSLLQLDRALMSFVNNALFRQPALVNPESALKARRDLDNVIQLSDAIEKTAKKMKEAPPHQ